MTTGRSTVTHAMTRRVNSDDEAFAKNSELSGLLCEGRKAVSL